MRAVSRAVEWLFAKRRDGTSVPIMIPKISREVGNFCTIDTKLLLVTNGEKNSDPILCAI
jgi:hypothetical protein